MGNDKIFSSFLYNFNNSEHYTDFLEKNNIKSLIKNFKNIYPLLNKIPNIEITIFPVFPPCAWGKDFIDTLRNKQQLSSGCTLVNRDGIIFDCDGTLLPCNAMHEIKLGKLDVDFSNAESLLQYYQTKRDSTFFRRFCNPPERICLECDKKDVCTYCACQWSNYTLSHLLNYLND